MEIKSTITAIIAAVVALIIVVVVAIPIISDTTENVHSEIQNENIRYAISSDTPVSMSIDASQIVVNGESMSRPSYSPVCVNSNYMAIGMAASDSAFILLGPDGMVASGISQITINGGNLTYTTTTTTTIETGEMYYISSAGNLGFFEFNTDIRINNDVTALILEYRGYYGTGLPRGYGTWEYLNGEITAGGIPARYGTQSHSEDTLATSSTVNYTSESAKFHTVLNVQNVTINEEYVYTAGFVLAPIEYTTVTSSDSAIISMIQTVPLLMIVGIIVAVTATFIRTR